MDHDIALTTMLVQMGRSAVTEEIIRPSHTSKGMHEMRSEGVSTVSPRMSTRGRVVRGWKARGDASLRRILDQTDEQVYWWIAVVAMKVDGPVNTLSGDRRLARFDDAGRK